MRGKTGEVPDNRPKNDSDLLSIWGIHATDVDQLDSPSVPELVALVKQLLVLLVRALEPENATLKEQLRAPKRATTLFRKPIEDRPQNAPHTPHGVPFQNP